jgi:hypothetical protein
MPTRFEIKASCEPGFVVTPVPPEIEEILQRYRDAASEEAAGQAMRDLGQHYLVSWIGDNSMYVDELEEMCGTSEELQCEAEVLDIDDAGPGNWPTLFVRGSFVWPKDVTSEQLQEFEWEYEGMDRLCSGVWSVDADPNEEAGDWGVAWGAEWDFFLIDEHE